MLNGGIALEEKKQEMICDQMTERIIETVSRLALENGADNLNVRKVLQALNITNRVFYNRFHNIDEVLDIVYQKIALKIRASITAGFDPEGDFFEQVKNIVANTLLMSYDFKMQFNNYVFKSDSLSNRNFEWWKTEIEKLIEFGKAKGHFGNVDTEVMSYSIWCFIRGYNADAVGRGIPRDEAVENFRYSFGILLEGMRVAK